MLNTLPVSFDNSIEGAITYGNTLEGFIYKLDLDHPRAYSYIPPEDSDSFQS